MNTGKSIEVSDQITLKVLQYRNVTGKILESIKVSDNERCSSWKVSEYRLYIWQKYLKHRDSLMQFLKSI